MASLDPLPFRLDVPKRDIFDWHGYHSISYRIEGLLHVVGDTIELEWSAMRRTEHVAVTGVKDEVDRSPVATCELPIGWISGARVRGGWLAPRLELRARRLDAFDGIPGARPAVVILRLRHRDRAHAYAVAAAIDTARSRTLPAG